MTKQKLQKEILEKVKPGTKPSDLKKLKRSKSADDIPSAPTSVPLSKSKSQEPFIDPQYPYTSLVSQQQTIEKLEKETTAKSDTIKLLRKKIEDLEKNNPPNSLLNDQLKQKQIEIESLRKKLEETNSELNSLKKEKSNLLDDNLTLKRQGLKDWFKQYQKTKDLETELKENVDYASEELVKQDKVINSLQGKVTKLEQQKESLKKDLNLATKLAELRKGNWPDNSPNYLKPLVFLTIATITLYFLMKQ
jgi:predicted RNase H-like nuclease (RuvC/YqgF family)